MKQACEMGQEEIEMTFGFSLHSISWEPGPVLLDFRKDMMTKWPKYYMDTRSDSFQNLPEMCF